MISSSTIDRTTSSHVHVDDQPTTDRTYRERIELPQKLLKGGWDTFTNSPTISGTLAEVLLGKLAHALQFDIRKYMKSSYLPFVGTMPVTLLTTSLIQLREKRDDYLVSAKANGVRYLFFKINDQIAYLVSREWTIVNAIDILLSPTTSLEKSTSSPSTTMMTEELLLSIIDKNKIELALDGELLKQKDGTFRYITCDLLISSSICYCREPLHFRLSKLGTESILEDTRWKITNKPWYKCTSKEAEKLIREGPGEGLSHDGLIFANSVNQYVFLTDKSLFKWKPNPTVDFYVKLRETNLATITNKCLTIELYVFDGRPGKQQNRLVVVEKLHFETDSRLKDVFLSLLQLNNKIVEMSYCTKDNSWIFEGERIDKTRPNSLPVYLDTLSSIKGDITRERLIEALDCKIKV